MCSVDAPHEDHRRTPCEKWIIFSPSVCSQNRLIKTTNCIQYLLITFDVQGVCRKRTFLSINNAHWSHHTKRWKTRMFDPCTIRSSSTLTMTILRDEMRKFQQVVNTEISAIDPPPRLARSQWRGSGCCRSAALRLVRHRHRHQCSLTICSLPDTMGTQSPSLYPS